MTMAWKGFGTKWPMLEAIIWTRLSGEAEEIQMRPQTEYPDCSLRFAPPGHQSAVGAHNDHNIPLGREEPSLVHRRGTLLYLKLS
jgi:hypothetical protein